MKLKQCSILLVNPGRCDALSALLTRMGFGVHHLPAWPDEDRVLLDFQAIVVGIHAIERAPMIAARIRVKPHFGRRVLIAIVAETTPPGDRRTAQASGFDEVMTETCDSRLFVARILRKLRTRPELRCMLPSPDRRRRTAA